MLECILKKGLQTKYSLPDDEGKNQRSSLLNGEVLWIALHTVSSKSAMESLAKHTTYHIRYFLICDGSAANTSARSYLYSRLVSSTVRAPA